MPSRRTSSIAHLTDLAHAARTLVAAGAIGVDRPDRTFRALAALRRWGAVPAVGYAVNAARTPDRTALVDELGALTFADVEARTNAIARGFRVHGVRQGDGVAILCRNHRGFVESAVACWKLGATAVFMNTGFSGPQIAEVFRRERLGALVYDEEFAEAVGELAASTTSFVAWREARAAGEAAAAGGAGAAAAAAAGGAAAAAAAAGDRPALEQLVGAHTQARLDPPRATSGVVMLTSGTTGTPRGAARARPDTVLTFAPLFARIPLRARRTTVIAAPLFHTWGFGNFAWGLMFGSTLVLQRRFDPERTLAAVARHRAHALAVVPVMLQRCWSCRPTCCAATTRAACA